MPITTRRTISAGLAGAALLPPFLSHAQPTSSYPDKPIKVIVPFAAGGGADLLARLLAPKMSEALRQPIIVDNRPGAGTTIANDLVAKAAPDGYTLLQVNRDMAISPSTYATLPYHTLKAFSWIGKTADGPFVLVANPTVPARSLSELAALARATPGQVPCGNLAIGGIAHLGVEALMRHLGIQLLQVPYKGAGPALAAVVSGEISVTLASLASVIPFVREGRLRALAIGLDKRAAQLPDVPTVGEAGGGRDTVLPTFVGLAAPAGTPKPIIDRLNSEMRRLLAMPDVAERMIQNGFVPAYTTPEELASIMEKDVAHFQALVKAIGITPQ